jgi:hypothetical protein
MTSEFREHVCGFPPPYPPRETGEEKKVGHSFARIVFRTKG